MTIKAGNDRTSALTKCFVEHVPELCMLNKMVQYICKRRRKEATNGANIDWSYNNTFRERNREDKNDLRDNYAAQLVSHRDSDAFPLLPQPGRNVGLALTPLLQLPFAKWTNYSSHPCQTPWADARQATLTSTLQKAATLDAESTIVVLQTTQWYCVTSLHPQIPTAAHQEFSTTLPQFGDTTRVFWCVSQLLDAPLANDGKTRLQARANIDFIPMPCISQISFVTRIWISVVNTRDSSQNRRGLITPGCAQDGGGMCVIWASRLPRRAGGTAQGRPWTTYILFAPKPLSHTLFPWWNQCFNQILYTPFG